MGAHHDAAGTDEPFLHHELMADPFLEDVGDAVLGGEIAHQFVQAGRGDCVGGKNVVEDQDHALRVPEWNLEMAEGLDCQRSGDVVGHRVVDRRDHDLTGMNIPSEPSREDLFGQGSHVFSPKPGPSPGADHRVRHCSAGRRRRAA